ncbi:MAG: DNA topoisomerase I, partial [Candidatus Diapherotrites archaeon]|nr:DNA topoisomerase I [Candidatus Diapherotrites archaeon]
MRLIISEKVIAGNKIAAILSNGTAEKRFSGKIPVWNFEFQGEKTTVIPLSGHILDVDYPRKYNSWLGTDLEKLITVEPDYKHSAVAIIHALKEHAKDADRITIATDSDREGESIGLEAVEVVQALNKNVKVDRARFSAMTSEELTHAFDQKNIEPLNFNLAYAANARREIDLVWGAVLTRFLSLSSGRMGRDFLSAGRVQSPALALLVDREKDILKFKPVPFWVVSALLEKDKVDFEALHEKKTFSNAEDANEAVGNCEDPALVTAVSKRKKILKKPVPFNTTAFLQAANALNISAAEAMMIAESLYMDGYTSYPRTDNQVYEKSIDLKGILKNLESSPWFKKEARELLDQPKIEPSAGKKAEDHPPIHPVDFPKKKLPDKYWKIYELIVRRFFATLSTDCILNAVNVKLVIGTEKFQSNGQTIVDPGWKKYYPYSKTTEVVLPELVKGDNAKVIEVKSEKKETKPPQRFSQGSLIKRMEDMGIGTKSTRHEIIKKLQNRRYVNAGKVLQPTSLAFAVIGSLEKGAKEIVLSEMTSKLEEEMDLIAAKKKTKKEVTVDSQDILKEALKKLKKTQKESVGFIRSAVADANIVGKCPKCNKGDLRLIKSKATGKRFIGCSNYPECSNSFPAPQEGQIIALKTPCPECGLPQIKVTRKHSRGYQMCIDPKCKSKEGWGKKKTDS